jgi:hypothetical protein
MLARLGLACLTVALIAPVSNADEKDKKEPEKRGGTVVGEVTAKKTNMIAVKADGEEKAREYVPHWVGGLPKDGGGPDKKMVAEIAKVKVGSRVKIQWEFEERPRVLKIEILKEPAKEK